MDVDKVRVGPRIALALIGTAVYAAAGGFIGSMNAGWFDLERNSNPVLPFLGLGAGMVLVSFFSGTFHRRLQDAGGVGRGARILLSVGAGAYVLSWVVEFAIIGTLTFAAGLVCLTVAVSRFKLTPLFDRVLIAVSAVGSFTWNTETTSAFLLVGVGFLWMVLSVRLLRIR